MKDIVLILLVLLVTGSSAYAFFYESELNLSPGNYECPVPNQDFKCEISKDKIGGISYSNCGSLSESEIQRLVDEKKCIYTPDNNKYYSCQYENGSCSVVLYSPSGYSANCSGGIDVDRALKDAKAGKCYNN